MEKTKLINARIRKGFSHKDVADLLPMEEYSYRRREKGETKISHKHWKELAEILDVDFEEIFETELNAVSIHNENGQVNNNTYNSKIQYYNIPKEMIDNQQEYIMLLKAQIETLKNENENLKDEIETIKTKS